MRVLVVEDEPFMAEAIRDGLRLEAIAADLAGDGDTALELLSINAYDLAILDRDIPGPSGDEIARRIVASGSGIPILMLTAADRLDDKASGFGLGADDYLTKPFRMKELVARVAALLRRVARAEELARTSADGSPLELGDLRVDPAARRTWLGEQEVHLTPTEFDLLHTLGREPGVVLTRERLLAEVWGWSGAAGATRTVDSHVKALRAKIGADRVRTVHGVGYALEVAGETR